MSRSKYHTPICGMGGHVSVKPYREQENRAKRHKVKQYLLKGKYENLPLDKEYGNEWSSPRDGRQYFGHIPYTRCMVCRHHWQWYKRVCTCDQREKNFKELMRK
jgi:hypothetical protein